MRLGKIRASLMALALLAVASPEEVRAGSAGGSAQYNCGNANAGATASFAAGYSNSGSSASAYASATGYVSLLGKSAKGVEARVDVSSSGGKGSASYAVTLGGYIVASSSKSTSFNASTSAARSFLAAGGTFMVGPVPVKVSGSAGGGVGGSVSLGIAAKGVSYSGALTGWANGTASAGLGIPGYNVSLQATLTLVRSTLSPSASVSYSAASGGVSVCFNPYQILFQVTVKAWPASWSKDLGTFSGTSSCRTVAKF